MAIGPRGGAELSCWGLRTPMDCAKSVRITALTVFKGTQTPATFSASFAPGPREAKPLLLVTHGKVCASGSGTRQRLELRRVPGSWHTAKFKFLPCASDPGTRRSREPAPSSSRRHRPHHGPAVNDFNLSCGPSNTRQTSLSCAR